MGMYTLIFSTINFRCSTIVRTTHMTGNSYWDLVFFFRACLQSKDFGVGAIRLPVASKLIFLPRGWREAPERGADPKPFAFLPLGWTFGVSPPTPADQAHPMSPGCHTIVAHLSTSRKKRGGRPLKLRACRWRRDGGKMTSSWSISEGRNQHTRNVESQLLK